MADGYLEKRYEEVFGKGAKKTVVKHTSIDTLFEKNRSYRGYKKDFEVKREMLERIVAVNTKIASAKNQQVLRFKLVTKETGADTIVQNMKLGGLLPELHLPFEGTEPEAFIIICSTIPENKFVDIDLGIAAQSMLLKATEMGLNGIMIGAFNKAKTTEAFNLPYEPLLILAIGKGNEKIKLQPVDEGEKLAYYRDEKGTQFVPKIRWNHLILQFLVLMALVLPSCRQSKPRPVPTISIEYDSIAWDEKCPCVVTYTDENDQFVEYGKIKHRGGMSSAYPKHSFTIKMDHKQALAGLPEQRAWILNANYIDKTMMRHKLCFDLFREMNPKKNLASQCAYVNVSTNGEYYGLFVLMQKLNAGSLGLNKKDSLAMIFKDPPLFYRDSSKVYVQDTNNYYQQSFPDIEDEDKNGYLKAVQQFLNHANDSLFASEIGNYFDLENILDWHLLLRFTNNGDGVVKNFYLYKRDNDTPFRIAIWDCDAAFGRDCDGELNMAERKPNIDGNVLFYRLQNNPYLQYGALLKQRYKELRDTGLFSESHIKNMIKDNDRMIKHEVDRNFEKWPTEGQYYYDANNYEQELQIMFDYLEIAIPQLDKEMGY